MIPRTLVIGLDGATPELLFGGIERGDLPVLGRLLEGSAHGPLRSTIPPMTLPAWASFLTGTSPGEHGIFDFMTREPGTGTLRVVDARDRAVSTIPRRLSDEGFHVGTFLFPTTWPPAELSGGQISGFDSPVATRAPPQAFAPPHLRAEVRELLGRELAYADFSELRKGPRWEGRAAASLLDGIASKERLACWLATRGKPYDFLGVLFGETDTASHHFWHFSDPRSPRHDPAGALEHGDVLLATYRRLDAAIGAILEADPGFDFVIVASDHGFGGAGDRVLHLNSFLAREGFLRWGQRPGWAGPVRAALAAAIPARILEHTVRAAPPSLLAKWDGAARWGQIDFVGTEAFSDELNYAPSIRLNTAGRDPQGIVPDGRGGESSRAVVVDRLIRALQAWRDPIDGGAVVRAVHRREDLYPGPCLDRAPDLYLELETPGGYSYSLLASRPSSEPSERLPRRAYRGSKGAAMSGSHRRDGVYILRGPGVEAGRRGMDITDLLPAWLQLIGRPDLGPPRPSPPRSPDVVSPDPDALASRLRSLGYLDR